MRLRIGKSTIASIILTILLAGVGGLYLQTQMQYSSLESTYSKLKDVVDKQYLKRDSVRVIVYAPNGTSSYEGGNKIVEALEHDYRIKAVVTDDQNDLTLTNLEANFDAAVLYQHNIPGQPSFLSSERIADLINFAESCHMLVAVHHGIYDPNRDNLDPTFNIRALTDYLGGYLWDTSTSRNPPLLDGIEDNNLNVADTTHYLAEGVSNFTVEDDEVYYALVTSENITPVIENRDYGPFVWSRGSFAVYMQIGHFPRDFDHPMVRRILQNAVLHLPITD